jgi:hypothetical protein
VLFLNNTGYRVGVSISKKIVQVLADATYYATYEVHLSLIFHTFSRDSPCYFFNNTILIISTLTNSSQNIDHKISITQQKNMNAANRNNNNNMDDIVVVHKIPKWPKGGMSPWVQLDIMAGQYNRTTQPELDSRFEKQRLLAAVEANAKAQGVAVIHSDE